jgi:hypothetical protein
VRGDGFRALVRALASRTALESAFPASLRAEGYRDDPDAAADSIGWTSLAAKPPFCSTRSLANTTENASLKASTKSRIAMNEATHRHRFRG